MIFFVGFIGVVVALGVLILACCSAVFYLLRYHEPNEQERALRRQRYGREGTEQDSGPVRTPSFVTSIGAKLREAWNRIRHGSRRGGRGWIQAGSDDEWESDAVRGDPARPEAKTTGGPVQPSAKNNITHTVDIVGSNASGFVSTQNSDLLKGSPISQASPITRSQSNVVVSPSREDENAEQRRIRDHHRHMSSLSTSSGTRFVEHI